VGNVNMRSGVAVFYITHRMLTYENKKKRLTIVTHSFSNIKI
jgi:hypothetical protein